MKPHLCLMILATIAIFPSAAQTVSSVKSVNENFDEDEGIVMVGKITGTANPQNDETEYNFTDNGTDNIRVDFEYGMEIPSLNETITVSGIMDIDDHVNEVDIKYWHTGDSTIVQKLGLQTVQGLKEKAEDSLYFAVVGQFSSFAPMDSEYNFKDASDSMVILTQTNAAQPDWNRDVLILGRVSKFETTTAFFVWFNEYHSGSSGIDPLSIEMAYSLYPNPADDFFSIRTEQAYSHVVIYDAAGKMVKKMDFNGSNAYAIQDLSPGSYYVSIRREGRLLQTLQLSIQ